MRLCQSFSRGVQHGRYNCHTDGAIEGGDEGGGGDAGGGGIGVSRDFVLLVGGVPRAEVGDGAPGEGREDKGQRYEQDEDEQEEAQRELSLPV